MYNVRKAVLDIANPKLRYIVQSSLLRRKFETLLLLECKDIGTIFSLSEDEIKEYKENFFDIDPLSKMGRLYILDYLERSGDKEMLKCYLRGEEYTKAKFGISGDISNEAQGTLFRGLVNSTLFDSLDQPIMTKLACIKTLRNEISPEKKESEIDKLSKILENIDL